MKKYKKKVLDFDDVLKDIRKNIVNENFDKGKRKENLDRDKKNSC